MAHYYNSKGERVEEDMKPDWETLWLVLETNVKKNHPEAYADLQQVVVIDLINIMAKENGWEVPIGLK